jgi:Predicted nucleic acid-binding protein, contains PIN domain
MKPVFADTGFFLALVNARDQYHQAATSLNASLVTPLLTTAWVLLEFANAIATSRARSEFGSTLARLRSERGAEIIPPSPELFDRGCELYTSRSDKEWSLTDCISFVVMKGSRREADKSNAIRYQRADQQTDIVWICHREVMQL